MIELTQEQRQQLEIGQAADVIDQETARPYVVLPRDVYEQVRPLLEDRSEWSQDELRVLLAQSSQGNGWDEPEMDAYDHYDEEVNKRRW
jgi:hypothetical protein